MRSFIVLIAVLVMCSASEASAQGIQPQDYGLISSAPNEPYIGERSPQTAFLLSFLGSAVPMGVGLLVANSVDNDAGGGIFALGATVGPSLGHFYAGRPGRALLGIGIRTGALAVTILGINSALMESESSSADAATVVGFLTFCASGIIDIATAPASARRTNRELEENRFELRGERLRSSGDLALGLQYRF